MKIIKYTFDVAMVAMVSHIPAKSRMAVNYVTGVGTKKSENLWWQNREDGDDRCGGG